MPTYNGISFEVIGSAEWPEFSQDAISSTQAIPYANKEYLQFAGRSNRRLTCTGRFTALADVQTLQGSMGSTRRTLSSYNGANYTNTVLRSMGQVRRVGLAGTRFLVDLTFEREGT